MKQDANEGRDSNPAEKNTNDRLNFRFSLCAVLLNTGPLFGPVRIGSEVPACVSAPYPNEYVHACTYARTHARSRILFLSDGVSTRKRSLLYSAPEQRRWNKNCRGARAGETDEKGSNESEKGRRRHETRCSKERKRRKKVKASAPRPRNFRSV